MRSIDVSIVLIAMALASRAVPVEDRCHLSSHLRPLSCEENDKHPSVRERALSGLGIGIKLPQTKNIKLFHTTNPAPPTTDHPPTSSITKATLISPSPTNAATNATIDPVDGVEAESSTTAEGSGATGSFDAVPDGDGVERRT